MIDRKKAIRILEGHYKNSVLRHNGEILAVNELIELLKTQEPVKPAPAIDDVGDWLCGNCYNSVVGYEELDASGFTPVKFDFCPKCGRAVKWE